MAESTEAEDGGNTIVTTISDNRNIIIGFFAGVITVWMFGGQKGENSQWIMAASVIGFIIYTQMMKGKDRMSYIDVINQIAEEARRNGHYLDTDPRTIRVYKKGYKRYVFDFTKNKVSYGWEGRVIQGVQEVYDRSMESLKMEKDSRDLELKAVDLEEIKR
jgi:hypothetical protein